MIYCTVLHCTEMKYNATNCTVLNRAALHCHINTNITITFTFLNKFLLYLKNTKVWYYVLISFFMRKKNVCIYKTNSSQTNNKTYEIMILLNNVTYFIYSILAHYSDVQRSAVYCSALYCSLIHYSEFLFSSGKCSTLHLRAIYYNTCTHLHQSALGSSLSFAIKYTLFNM